MGLAAVFKFVVDGLKVIPADVSAAFKSFKGEVGMEVYPALLGVGYIVGPRIASFMFVGSIIGWMVIIPMICLFGPDTWLYPADPELLFPSSMQLAEHQQSGANMLNTSVQVLSQLAVSFP